ncbi:MAG: acetyl-CoA carboxylase biotin carboxylase subunit family protein [Bacilli bacterium]
MKKIIFISPHFPKTYYRFVEAMKKRGFITLGIGDSPYNDISDELKSCLDEYYTCPDMDNFDNEIKAVKYFVDKYHDIDYLESNNEYWLEKDAKLREMFNIKNGVRGSDIEFYNHKSKMKEKYAIAGVPFARYILVSTLEKLEQFVEEVKYPIFIKPDVGVGAYGDFKINNYDDLINFFNEKVDGVSYIAEEFIDGDIVSFDGISSSTAEVLFFTSNEFPPSIADIVKEKSDVFYYTNKKTPTKLEKYGHAVIKAFDVKNRFFHLEFFRLKKGKKNLGRKGDYVALETNMRPAGGYTPDLINFANSVSCYEIWGDSLAYDTNNFKMDYPKYYAGCASRRDIHNYYYGDYDIISKFKNNLCWYGRYPDIFSGAMGNRFFMAKFETFEELMEFKEFVSKRV